MRTESFATPEPISLAVSNGAGTITITATETDTSTVEIHGGRAVDDTTVEFTSGRLTVRSPEHRFGSSGSLDITIMIPNGSTAELKGGSADIAATGSLSRLIAATGSGDVRADHITGDAEVTCGSGSVDVETVTGTAKLHSASGDVRVTTVGGDARITTASGDISVGRVGGGISANTASGDMSIESLSGAANLRGVSGDIEVALAPGLAARLDISSLTGDVQSQLSVSSDQPTEGAPVTISANTVSGDILVRRAAGVPAT